MPTIVEGKLTFVFPNDWVAEKAESAKALEGDRTTSAGRGAGHNGWRSVDSAVSEEHKYRRPRLQRTALVWLILTVLRPAVIATAGG